MIDYFTVNLNVVASDWLNYNTGWWRGLNPEGNHKKWGYILWDLDATFDYYINYSGVPNTNPDAVPCDIDQIAQFLDNWFPNSTDTCLLEDPVPADCPFVNGKHEKIFIKLREESPDFRKLYFQRQADLSNTVFSCENMLFVFDSMVAVYAPEMPRHIQRWGGSMQEWEQNVATMRDFITQRCQLLDDGMVNCFEVTGPHKVTLLVEPPGAGEIDFNTLDIEEFPWTGNYFGNMENRIEANAKGALPFLRWESRAGNAITPSVNDDVAAITLTQPDTLVAVFGIATHTWEPGDGIVLNVFPTMATDMVQVDYTLVQPLPVRITLISAAGRVVSEIPRPDGSAGEHSLRLDLNELNVAPGVYLLDFQAGNARTTAKLVVVR
jgi:hypothetical protein